ncbi:hypothetical protein [Ferruginibacter sp.]|nr:hypothetical protein [Ferruginibacter sp.]
MDLQEQYIEDYTSGFNHAYILAEYSPELLADIDQSNNPVNDYFEGFFAGKEHYQMEQEQSKELDELGVLRSNSKDRDKEFERE